MRVRFLGGVTGLALALASLPAEAAWHGYVNKEAGFSFYAPGDVKAEKSAYTSKIAGARPATIYRSVDDNIEYRVTVVDFAGRAKDEAAIIKEAATVFGANKKVLADAEARVESSYGRKLTIDLPNNGGRSMSGVFFSAGHLIQLQATVLPANGDYGSPDIGRFVNSLAFGASTEPDVTELKLAK